MEVKYKGDCCERINIRCTPEQKKFLLDAAAAAGLTLSGYLLGDKLGSLILDSQKKSKK